MRHFLASLALACLAGTVRGQEKRADAPKVYGGCTIGKSAHAPVPALCDYSSGGFHVVCPAVHAYINASAACAAYGWRLADITDANAMYAAAVLDVCVRTGFAWISSFNGLTGEPCMFANGDGVAMTAAGSKICLDWTRTSFLTGRVLCQEIAVDFTTPTETSTMTVTQGVSTRTTTTTIFNRPTTLRTNPRDFESKALLPKNCTGRCPEGLCHDVCPFQYPNLRIIKNSVLYQQADEVCRQHGWRLATLSTGSIAQAVDLFEQCFGEGVFVRSSRNNSLWIQAYNGIASASCSYLYYDRDPAYYTVAFALSMEACNALAADRETAVLCQTDGLVVAESDGGWHVPNQTVSITESTTVVELVPSSTTTVTVTKTKKNCNKKHWGH